jgi:hypothetical protein
MTKNRTDAQLSLDFSQKQAGNETRSNIVPFIDSATIEARRTALRRVARSGIFSPPKIRM